MIADPVRLKQVLLNLISNALKYNKPGGCVQIDIGVEGSRTHIKVIDQGLGMSPQQLLHLYEPFNRLGREQSVYAGTGIGLLITKNLLELMGSELQVQSQEAIGSTFAFTLASGKNSRTALPEVEPGPQPQAFDLYGERQVLYVEDNRSNCEIIGAMLAFRPQINLTYSHSCQDAKRVLQNETIDLVLMDIHLPDGSGVDLATWIRDQISDRIPVIFVSADAAQLTQTDLGADNVVARLSKPLDLNQTLSTIDQWLNQQPQTQVQ